MSAGLPVFDPEAFGQTELNPDVYALASVVNELRPLLKEQTELYSDARRRLVDGKRRNVELSFSEPVVVEQRLGDKVEMDDGQFRQTLAQLLAQLRQVDQERRDAIIASEELAERLGQQIRTQSAELAEYRQQELGEFSMSSPSRSTGGRSPVSFNGKNRLARDADDDSFEMDSLGTRRKNIAKKNRS
jgi:hypothetical protein